jgi:hypothetical protein
MMGHHIPANWNLEFVIYLEKSALALEQDVLLIKAVKSERVGLGVTFTILHLMEECILIL